MPYIKQADRDIFDEVIDLCQELMDSHGALSRDAEGRERRKGIVNYTITKIVVQNLKPDTGWSYASLSNAISVFEDAGYEMRRRLLSNYENNKILEHGDLNEYSTEQ